LSVAVIDLRQIYFDAGVHHIQIYEALDMLTALKVAVDEMEADQRLVLLARMAAHGSHPISV
jgi:hypothetical protein